VRLHPPIMPQVAEHRFHQLVCPDCGCGTRALIPEIVEHGYGVNVVAHVGLLVCIVIPIA